MQMSSELISNKKKYYLAIDWLPKNVGKKKFQMHYLDKRDSRLEI